jgi:hypothetical protein
MFSLPPIPQHLKDGSWANRFNTPQQGQAEKAQTEEASTSQSVIGKADPKKQMIAFGDDASISQDPITKLFEIIVGGAIVGTVKTLKDAYDWLQHNIHQSTSDNSEGEGKTEGAEKGKISGTTDHAEERKDQAASGDKGREVGDANRVVREGKRLKDSESGNDVYVNGDRVVVVDPKTGKQITQFKNTRKNTQQRIRSGKWILQ